MKAVKNIILLATVMTSSIVSLAQSIDNSWSYKNINSDRYLRITYDNDFFTAMDKYYTQGANIEIASPALKKYWISRLLVTPGYDYVRYGITGAHEGYTPRYIDRSEILQNDRPFAACWYVKTFQVSIDTIKKQRFSTTLSTGVIGPAALGNELQTIIHRALGNVLPNGWHNQIRNDAVLNYQVNYEHQLLAAGKYFMMDAGGMVRAGTLSDKASVGMTLMAGYFESPYSAAVLKGKDLRIYAYEHPEVSYVAYDATLQGGVFNRQSPYVIPARDIERITFMNRWGLVLNYRRVTLEYFQVYLTPEFSGGGYHTWGGVQVGVGL